MNLNKLYILYFALVFLVGFSLISTILGDVKDGFMEGWELAEKHPIVGEEENAYWFGVSIPNSKENSDFTIIKQRQEGDVLSITPRRIDAFVERKGEELPKQVALYELLRAIIAWPILGLSIFMLCLLYKLFRRMQKTLKAGVAFSLEVAKVMRSLGMTLVALSVLSFLFYFFQYKASVIMLGLYGYKIDCGLELDYILLIFGIALLLVAEFLKIGYKMQEEQSLTV